VTGPVNANAKYICSYSTKEPFRQPPKEQLPASVVPTVIAEAFEAIPYSAKAVTTPKTFIFIAKPPALPLSSDALMSYSAVSAGPLCRFPRSSANCALSTTAGIAFFGQPTRGRVTACAAACVISRTRPPCSTGKTSRCPTGWRGHVEDGHDTATASVAFTRAATVRQRIEFRQ
jgi:hypothetical protein